MTVSDALTLAGAVRQLDTYIDVVPDGAQQHQVTRHCLLRILAKVLHASR